MDGQVIMKIIKGVLAVLGIIGVSVTPEQTEAIATGGVALYAVIEGIEGYLKHKKSKA